jgi:hypothetical protein
MADLYVLTSHKLEKKHEATSTKLEAKRCWLPEAVHTAELEI